MDIEKVRALVDLVVESGIASLTVESGDLKIKVLGQGTVIAPPVAAGPAAPPPPAAVTAAVPEAPAPSAPDLATRPVTSPIVGTFYRAAAPGSPNLVEVGQRVAVGETLCIIEAMKVMNEIEAEFPGIVREICVENAQPVEAEAVLFRIEPL
jgi:acetyl-CoA carboxylase biotin carboxyl carrier protein